MRPPRGIAVALTVAATLVIGVVLLLRGGGGPTYDRLRQRTDLAIPGALGYELAPAPEGFRPVLTPAEAQARYPAEGGDVTVTLASVRDTFEDELFGPAWVLFARGVCLRNAKGELVSDARGNDPNDLECTDATIWILAVDPATGDPLVALTAYDESGEWGPDPAA